METVNILWTGGLDSTCRIAELSIHEIIIHPYYVLDPTRVSYKKELKAIKKITAIIRDNPKTKCDLRDLSIISMESIQDDKEITKAWETIHQKYSLGSQYDWLARFAKANNLVFEVGLENSPRSKAMKVIKEECQLAIDETNDQSSYMIVKKKSSRDAVLLFENLRFPSTLWKMSKLEEIEEMKQLGLEKIIMKTWFCHRPIFGMACGHCNPCKDALNEGLGFRVSWGGYLLGTIRQYTEILKNVCLKVKKLLIVY